MFTRKKKIGSKIGVIKPGNRLLRLLRSNTGFQALHISLQGTDEEDTYSVAQKEVGNAMLEAEYKKAKVIMMMQQQRRNFC